MAMLVDRDDEKEYKEAFRIFDQKVIGYIPCNDFQIILAAFQGEVGMTDEEIINLLDVVDNNKDGRITFNEFYKFMCD